MKRMILAGFACLALVTGTPAAAQVDEGAGDSMAELDALMADMSAIFPREPLSPEQEARLPAAERIISLMIPEGAMSDIMGGLIDDIFQPMMEMGPSASAQTLAKAIGVPPTELELDEEKSADLARLFDPAYEQRRNLQFALLPDLLREMMTTMEPGLRVVMSELYAIKFTQAELTDIEAFFSTETGRKYARESFAMASDPRIMSASMEALPAMMGALGDMEARMEEVTADLPPVRRYVDLTEAERARVIEATGLSDEDIRYSIDPEGWAAEADEYAEEAAKAAESQ